VQSIWGLPHSSAHPTHNVCTISNNMGTAASCRRSTPAHACGSGYGGWHYTRVYCCPMPALLSVTCATTPAQLQLHHRRLVLPTQPSTRVTGMGGQVNQRNGTCRLDTQDIQIQLPLCMEQNRHRRCHLRLQTMYARPRSGLCTCVCHCCLCARHHCTHGQARLSPPLTHCC
jgi:hypothetical protein